MSEIIQASDFTTRIETASECAIGPNDPTVKIIISKPSVTHHDETSIAAIVAGLLVSAVRLGS